MLIVGLKGFGQITNSDLAKMEMNSTQKWKIKEFEKLAFDSNVQVTEIANCIDKKIIFIGTHHIGTKLYYNNILSLIDSFHTLGYAVYYEGIRADTNGNGFMFKKQIGMKYKRIEGQSYNIHEFYQKVASYYEGLITQPSFDSLGMTDIDVNADVSVRDVVEFYESKYGLVHDSIPLQKNYQEIRNDIHQTFRNKYITSLITKSEQKKIVILFGLEHLVKLQESFNVDCG